MNPRDSHTFILAPGIGDEDNEFFEVVDNRLVTSRSFDRETKAEYHIRIQTRDADGGIYSKPFVIVIQDANDSPPAGILLSPGAVEENQPAGALVGALSAVDPDSDAHHVFSLVAGEGDEDNGAFSIQGDRLVTAQPLDFEAKPYCQVRLQVSDGQNPSFVQALTISVLDLRDNAPPSDLTLTCACLADGSPSNTAVGALRVRDLNPTDKHALSLVRGEGDADNDWFQIRDRILFTAVPIRLVAQTPLEIRVQADDGQGGNLQKQFRIVPAAPLWQEDFERGLGQWTHAAEVGRDVWDIAAGASMSPSRSLAAAGDANPSDASAFSPWIPIPVRAEQIRLDFYHHCDWGEIIEQPLDAGVLEWRRRDEAWQDALTGDGGHHVVVGGYTAKISPAVSHPLSERSVWSGNTDGRFVPVTVALNPLAVAGQTVQFRWRQAVTSGAVSPGWRVDDIKLGVVLSSGEAHPFRIITCLRRAGQLELTWQSVPNQPYTVEISPAPGTAPWTPVGEGILGASGAEVTTRLFDLAALPGYPHQTLYFRIKSP